LAVEALDIKAELLRVADEIDGLECVLVVEQQVVHLPERVLFGGCLGCLGQTLCQLQRSGRTQVSHS
jgi:hypothetical protein